MGIVLPSKNSLPEIPQDKVFEKEVQEDVEEQIVKEEEPVVSQPTESSESTSVLDNILIAFEQRILNLEAALYRIKGAI